MKKIILILALTTVGLTNNLRAAEDATDDQAGSLRDIARDTLYSAIRDNKIEQVQNLLAGEFVNANTQLRDENNNETCPMHVAAKAGNKDIMSLLLENGALLNTRMPDGTTTLIIIQEHNSPKLLRAFDNLQRRAGEIANAKRAREEKRAAALKEQRAQ